MGYPGAAELRALASVLGGQVLLQAGSAQMGEGEGPVVAHIRYFRLRDGANVSTGHFELLQSWMPLRRAAAEMVQSERPSLAIALSSPDAQP